MVNMASSRRSQKGQCKCEVIHRPACIKKDNAIFQGWVSKPP